MATFVVIVLVLIVLAACVLLGMALWGQSLNRAQAQEDATKIDHIEHDTGATFEAEPEPTQKPSKSRIRVELDHDRIANFPGLETKQARCVGMMHYLSDNQRRSLNPPFVIAVPEPSNRHDPNAITIASVDGRRYGYLSAGQAKMYSPLIQEIGALQVSCRVDGIKLWLDLPTVPELRKAVRKWQRPS